MPYTIETLAALVHKQGAELAIKGRLISALLQQAQDKQKLIRDFAEMAEDGTVRTMYSGMPEEFFQEFETQREAWEGLLQAVADDE